MGTGIGAALREARRRQGYSIEDAAAVTMVRGRYLDALEREEFQILGSAVYARGFLTTYARFLGLDPAPLLEAHHRESAVGQGQAPTRADPHRAWVAILVVLAVVAVTALLVAGWHVLGAQA